VNISKTFISSFSLHLYKPMCIRDIDVGIMDAKIMFKWIESGLVLLRHDIASRGICYGAVSVRL